MRTQDKQNLRIVLKGERRRKEVGARVESRADHSSSSHVTSLTLGNGQIVSSAK